MKVKKWLRWLTFFKFKISNKIYYSTRDIVKEKHKEFTKNKK